MNPNVNCLHRHAPTSCQHCGLCLSAVELRYMEQLKQPQAALENLIWEDMRYRAYFLVLCQEGIEAELREHAWRFRSGLWERGQIYSVGDVANALVDLIEEFVEESVYLS